MSCAPPINEQNWEEDTGGFRESWNDLAVIREKPNDKDTPGVFTHLEEFLCYSLEDIDRGLHDQMTVKEIRDRKIYGITAIPVGRYRMVWYDSPKHGRVPLLKNVKGFSYIEIHPANWAHQLLGCIAPGLSRGTNSVLESKKAFKLICDRIKKHDITHISIHQKITAL